MGGGWWGELMGPFTGRVPFIVGPIKKRRKWRRRAARCREWGVVVGGGGGREEGGLGDPSISLVGVTSPPVRRSSFALYRVLLGLTACYRVEPCFTGFYRVLLGFNEFERVLLVETLFFQV